MSDALDLNPMDDYLLEKEKAKTELAQLVHRYASQRASYIQPSYREARLRSDFLNPLLRIFGWDLDNVKNLPQHLREVVEEDAIDVVEDDVVLEKNPDYTLLVGGQRKLFVEAKKPSVNIASSSSAAFQVRRYGWSTGLKVSVLTNFEALAIYRCQYQPGLSDETYVERYNIYNYDQYLDNFDELYDLLSRDAVYGGSIEAAFEEDQKAGTQPFDAYFLEQIEGWREDVAKALFEENENLSAEVLNYLVERLINRIIFLRICEARKLEVYEQLRGITTYEDLKTVFLEADRKYNSGLFDFAEDTLSLNVNLKPDVLVSIFRELYLPQSPYAFSVVEADVLGEIYELFLGREVVISAEGTVKVVEKPEVAALRGVVPTPSYITEEIVRRTLAPMVAGKAPIQLDTFRVCDCACGSGSFLLAAFAHLLNHYREWYIANGPETYPEKIYQGVGNTWFLSLEEKQRILLNSIYGVDIDLQATEVARFSLLLKLIEDETPTAIDAYMRKNHVRALPNLESNIRRGNSLVDARFYEYEPTAELNEPLLEKVRPFDFEQEFPQVMQDGGFDAIVGNPPYIRIQNMVQYSSEELAYYRSDLNPFTTATSSNIDKYYLFLERSLALLKMGGRLGYIVPHKFFVITAGKKLRELITVGRHLSEITHFGVNQVFPQRSTYTAIVVLNKGGANQFIVERVKDLSLWRTGTRGDIVAYRADEVGKDPWVFLSTRAKAVFARIDAQNVRPLRHFADIFVGLQTSADDVYIQTPASFSTAYDTEGDQGFINETIAFQKDGRVWEIETAILVPLLYDVTLTPYQTVRPNAFMIFPYHLAGGRALPYTGQEMEEQFPRTWAYLNTYRARLRGRNVSGGTTGEWYRFGRSQSLTRFDGREKLIWTTLALNAPYAYDRRNTRFTGGGNGPYYALTTKLGADISLFYLLAVLSHPVLEAMVKAKASEFRGAYYSHGKQFVANLPIRVINDTSPNEAALYERIVETVRTLVAVADQLAGSLLPDRRRTLQMQRERLSQSVTTLVSQLYGLQDEDIEAIAGDNLLVADTSVEETNEA